MRHLKRVIALIAMLAMSVACVGPVYAADGSNGTQASPTLAMYAVWLDPGDSAGELDVTFDVTATEWADSLGVSYFEIHEASSGALVRTVRGTTSNGLTRESASTFTNTYTATGFTRGVYYYAIIAVYAEINGVHGSRTLTTGSVKAP